jgi:hypothetical protein
MQIPGSSQRTCVISRRSPARKETWGVVWTLTPCSPVGTQTRSSKQTAHDSKDSNQCTEGDDNIAPERAEPPRREGLGLGSGWEMRTILPDFITLQSRAALSKKEPDGMTQKEFCPNVIQSCLLVWHAHCLHPCWEGHFPIRGKTCLCKAADSCIYPAYIANFESAIALAPTFRHDRS